MKDAITTFRFSFISKIRCGVGNIYDHHVEMDHTMVDKMRMQYPYAFECATAILPLLKKNLGISVTEAEISYIAVYLAIILNSAEKWL